MSGSGQRGDSGRIMPMTSADWALWVAAAGTWAIGFAGYGAFRYARKTFEAQGEQLALARRDSLRMRTPVLRGELGMWSSTSSCLTGRPNMSLARATASYHCAPTAPSHQARAGRRL